MHISIHRFLTCSEMATCLHGNGMSIILLFKKSILQTSETIFPSSISIYFHKRRLAVLCTFKHDETKILSEQQQPFIASFPPITLSPPVSLMGIATLRFVLKKASWTAHWLPPLELHISFSLKYPESMYTVYTNSFHVFNC